MIRAVPLPALHLLAWTKVHPTGILAPAVSLGVLFFSGVHVGFGNAAGQREEQPPSHTGRFGLAAIGQHDDSQTPCRNHADVSRRAGQPAVLVDDKPSPSTPTARFEYRLFVPGG